MKRVLIISPYFAPCNAADMHRVRMSLPFFKNYGWQPTVLTVDEVYADMATDELLLQSIPADAAVYKIDALSKKWTVKLGLGSLALRSLLHLQKGGNRLLRREKFDLIYFSTTQFPVCILGPYWKKKFGVPYVIDMQDPWHSDYYQSKPKSERSPKYWFSYRLNKWTEPVAMKDADGLIAVSQAYIDELQQRYPALKKKPAATITFGAFEKDLDIAKNFASPVVFSSEADVINLVYIGVSGPFMQKALTLLFSVFKKGLKIAPDLYQKIRLHFIGTSYAPQGSGKQSITPIANKFGLQHLVNEQTDRLPFYTALASIQAADGLIVLGSDDPGYTASKLYPYIMSRRPLVGIFHPESSANSIIKQCNAGRVVSLNASEDEAFVELNVFLRDVAAGRLPQTNWTAFEQFSAAQMTRKQCDVFDAIVAARRPSGVGSK